MHRIAWRTSKNFLLHTSFKKAKSDSVKQVILGVIFLYIKKDRNEPCEMRNHSSPMIKKCLLKCQRKICFKNQSIILSLCVSLTHTHTCTRAPNSWSIWSLSYHLGECLLCYSGYGCMRLL